MPLTPPKALQTLLVGDSATSRAFQSVKSAVDPLLGLVNSTFQVANDGTLGFLRRVKTFAVDNLTAGSAVVNQNLGVKGDAVVAGKQTVVGPIVNVGGVQSSGPVSGTTLTGNNVVSAAGFKSAYNMGVVYSNPATAGTRYQVKVYTQSEQANAPYASLTLFQPPFAGSVVGISVYSLGTAGGTVSVQMFKSSTAIAQSPTTPWLNVSMGSASQFFGNTVAFAKGLYPFGVADFFSASASFTVAGNQFVSVVLWLELSA